MKRLILEYVGAVLFLLVFVLLPWVILMAIGTEDKLSFIGATLAYLAWWWVAARMVRFAIHDMTT